MAHVTECEGGYDGLAVAIVRQAVVDYRKASRYLAKHPREEGWRKAGMEVMYAQSRAFLTSSWCGALCGDKGEYILRRLREEEENAKKKKRKSHKRAPA